MRRDVRLLLGAGILAHLVCWWLPTYRIDAFGQSVMMGWEACWAALTLPLQNHEPMNAIYSLSALTNLVMWLALVRRWRRGPARRWGVALLACAALDAIWFVMPLAQRESVRDLLAGYYTWWASFALVGAALWVEAAGTTKAGASPPA